MNKWADPDRGPPEKSQVAMGFLRNSRTDTLDRQLDPLGPIASPGMSVRPSVKYVDDFKKVVMIKLCNTYEVQEHNY